MGKEIGILGNVNLEFPISQCVFLNVMFIV